MGEKVKAFVETVTIAGSWFKKKRSDSKTGQVFFFSNFNTCLALGQNKRAQR